MTIFQFNFPESSKECVALLFFFAVALSTFLINENDFFFLD